MQIPLAEETLPNGMLAWLLAGVGGAILAAAGVLWKAIQNKDHATIQIFREQIAALQAAQIVADGKLTALEIINRELRHKNVALTSERDVAQARLESILSMTRKGGVLEAHAQTINSLADPDGSHFGDALEKIMRQRERQ